MLNNSVRKRPRAVLVTFRVNCKFSQHTSTTLQRLFLTSLNNMKGFPGLLLFGFFLLLSTAQAPVSADWISNLYAHLEETNKKVHSSLNGVQEQLQHNLMRINEDVHKQLSNVQKQVEQAAKQEHTGTKVTVGNTGITVNNGNAIYVLNGNGGVYSTLTNIQQIGNKIYVNETTYDLVSKKKFARQYVIDLKDLNSKPMEIKYDVAEARK